MYLRRNQGCFLFLFLTLCVFSTNYPQSTGDLSWWLVSGFSISSNITTNPVSWHQVFLTGSLCALVCDLISYGIKRFCRKTGPLVSWLCEPLCLV